MPRSSMDRAYLPLSKMAACSNLRFEYVFCQCGADRRVPVLLRKHLENPKFRQARLAQLVERKTLNLVVVGPSPTVGGRSARSFSKQFIFRKCQHGKSSSGIYLGRAVNGIGGRGGRVA